LGARSHGLVVKADGSWPRGCGFKTRQPILDGWKQFASYYIKEKLENKSSQIGHTKKIFKKKKNCLGFSSVVNIKIVFLSFCLCVVIICFCYTKWAETELQYVSITVPSKYKFPFHNHVPLNTHVHEIFAVYFTNVKKD